MRDNPNIYIHKKYILKNIKISKCYFSKVTQRFENFQILRSNYQQNIFDDK